MYKQLFLGIAVLGCIACNREQKTPNVKEFEVLHDTIILTENSSILKRLETKKVKTRPYFIELVTAGTVRVIPNNYALITTPFAGRITKSHVRLGQKVSVGTPIFEISSPTFYETGKAYYQAKEEMDLALKNLKRQKDLLNKGVGIEKDVEEAEVNYAMKKKDFENALASLKVFQTDTSSLILGQPLVVRSPINGTVVENDIVIGLYIKEDSDPVATVAELNKIWVAGQVKEKDIRYINDSTEVEISLFSFPEEKIKCKIYHISSIIDEETRSVQVLIQCENKKKIMKPGMYVTAKFINTLNDAIVIPEKAIFQMNDAQFVFIHLEENKYLKRKVEILTTDKDSAVIKSGLSMNDEIITSGGFYLMEAK